MLTTPKPQHVLQRPHIFSMDNNIEVKIEDTVVYKYNKEDNLYDFFVKDNNVKCTNYNQTYGIPQWEDISKHLESESAFLDWVQKEYPEILKVPRFCPRCSYPLGDPDCEHIVRCNRQECRRNHGGNQYKQSVWKGSFFDGFRGGKHKLMEFLYHWLIGGTNKSIGLHSGWSRVKVQRWEQAVRDLVATVVKEDHQMIGGEGVVVEIDESKFGKRKYNKGHRVEGAWVFGGVELTPDRKCFAVVVPDRKRETLLPIIKAHIKPGSIIRSDFWKAYDIIPFEKGFDYVHEKVNHSKHYVDPETAVHTNTIEGTWHGIKRQTPVRRRNRKDIQRCLFEFIWRRRNSGNLWNGLMRALEEVEYLEDEKPKQTQSKSKQAKAADKAKKGCVVGIKKEE